MWGWGDRNGNASAVWSARTWVPPPEPRTNIQARLPMLWSQPWRGRHKGMLELAGQPASPKQWVPGHEEKLSQRTRWDAPGKNSQGVPLASTGLWGLLQTQVHLQAHIHTRIARGRTLIFFSFYLFVFLNSGIARRQEAGVELYEFKARFLSRTVPGQQRLNTETLSQINK